MPLRLAIALTEPDPIILGSDKMRVEASPVKIGYRGTNRGTDSKPYSVGG
jgi:hypothetical protein